jgi:hypothetical protein
MPLTDWIVILAITLMAITFFCARSPANGSIDNRARRLTGARLLAQAALAWWVALLIVAHGLLRIDGMLGLRPAPLEALGGAAMLICCGGYWTLRASRLLKARRLFTAC